MSSKSFEETLLSLKKIHDEKLMALAREIERLNGENSELRKKIEASQRNHEEIVHSLRNEVKSVSLKNDDLTDKLKGIRDSAVQLEEFRRGMVRMIESGKGLASISDQISSLDLNASSLSYSSHSVSGNNNNNGAAANSDDLFSHTTRFYDHEQPRSATRAVKQPSSLYLKIREGISSTSFSIFSDIASGVLIPLSMLIHFRCFCRLLN